MKIELVNNLVFAHYEGIKWQIDQVKNGKSDQLWVASSHPDLLKIVKDLGLDPNKVYDIQAGRYLSDKSDKNELYWADVKLPNHAQRVVNEDWSVSIVDRGQEIGRMKWFPRSNRIVEEVIWLDYDGVVDKKEVYQRDGQLFSVNFYSNNQPLQIDYYFGTGKLKLSEFFYDGYVNFIKDYDREIEVDNVDIFIKTILEENFSDNDYTVTMLGRELDFAPDDTTLKIPYAALEEDGTITNNLVNAIESPRENIKKIIVDSATNDKLIKQKLEKPFIEVVDKW